MSLNKMECDFNAIEAVVLSHHHGDHFLGIPFLLLGWQYSGAGADPRLCGPPGTEEVVWKLCALAYAGEARYPFELPLAGACCQAQMHRSATFRSRRSPSSTTPSFSTASASARGSRPAVRRTPATAQCATAY